jgi:hypothetical protein
MPFAPSYVSRGECENMILEAQCNQLTLHFDMEKIVKVLKMYLFSTKIYHGTDGYIRSCTT